MDLGSQSWVIQSSSHLDLLLDQFVEGVEFRGPVTLGVALRLHWVILEVVTCVRSCWFNFEFLALGEDSRDRRPSTPVRNLIVHVAPSSALSSSRLSREVGHRATGRTECW